MWSAKSGLFHVLVHCGASFWKQVEEDTTFQAGGRFRDAVTGLEQSESALLIEASKV